MNIFILRSEDLLARLVRARKIHAYHAAGTKDGGEQEARPHPGPLPQERVTLLPRRSRMRRRDWPSDIRVSGGVRGESPLLGGEDLGEGGISFHPQSNFIVPRLRHRIQAMGSGADLPAAHFCSLQTLRRFSAYLLLMRLSANRLNHETTHP
jgi:hypothetical protein